MVKKEIILACDLDNTLVGVSGYDTLLDGLAKRPVMARWIYLTGRNYFSAMEAIFEHGLIMPLALACDVGSTIYWEASVFADEGWLKKMSHGWGESKIVEAITQIDGIHSLNTFAPCRISGKFASHSVDTGAVQSMLQEKGLPVKAVFSNTDLVDFIPACAGKGPALKYITEKLNLDQDSVIVAGDSENDLDLFCGTWPGIVVGNAASALVYRQLPRNIYRSRLPGPVGVLEGILHHLENSFSFG